MKVKEKFNIQSDCSNDTNDVEKKEMMMMMSKKNKIKSNQTSCLDLNFMQRCHIESENQDMMQRTLCSIFKGKKSTQNLT